MKNEKIFELNLSEKDLINNNESTISARINLEFKQLALGAKGLF